MSSSIPQTPYGSHPVGLSYSDSELPKIKKQEQQTNKNTSQKVTLAIPKSNKITPSTETSNQSTESSSLNISEIKKDTPRTGLAKLANVTEALLKRAEGLEEENRDLKSALKAAKAEQKVFNDKQKDINSHQKDVNAHVLRSAKEQHAVNASHQNQITTLGAQVKQQKEMNKHQTAVNNEQADFSNNQKLFNTQQINLNDHLCRNIHDLQHGQVFLQAQTNGQQLQLNGQQAQIQTITNVSEKEPNLTYFS